MKSRMKKTDQQGQPVAVSKAFFADWFDTLPFRYVLPLAAAIIKVERAAGTGDIAELNQALQSHGTPKWRRFASEVLRGLEANKLTFKTLRVVMWRAAQIAYEYATLPTNPEPFKGSHADFMTDPLRDWASEKTSEQERADKHAAWLTENLAYASDATRGVREFIGQDSELLKIAHDFIFADPFGDESRSHTPAEMRTNINLLLSDVEGNSLEIKRARLFFDLAEAELRRQIAGRDPFVFVIEAILEATREGTLESLLDRLTAAISPHRSRDNADSNAKAMAITREGIRFSSSNLDVSALDAMFAVRWPRPVRLPDPSTNRQLARVAARLQRQAKRGGQQ